MLFELTQHSPSSGPSLGDAGFQARFQLQAA